VADAKIVGTNPGPSGDEDQRQAMTDVDRWRAGQSADPPDSPGWTIGLGLWGSNPGVSSRLAVLKPMRQGSLISVRSAMWPGCKVVNSANDGVNVYEVL
jgi:hypothetical protein